ncbi:hypothetical protein [uncultured Trichococcus sp.]|uniref:hypothetical protein n=1 Tax=uncultured Trichococcus sp. TaxID=189665 RepID=UPI002A18DA95|nr:hypothetical protein [uncultured Trichococcus sp.]
MKIRHELTPYFCDTYGIDRDKDYPVEWINPRTLLVSERLDLVAKVKYIEARESGQIAPFIRDCYVKHIEAFSYGTFKESGSKEKDSIVKYIDTFHQLIDAIKASGFDASKSVIPVGEGNILLDGAHRAAVAIYFNKKIPIIRIPGAKVTYDAAYFRKRLLGGLCLDYLMLEYAKMRTTVNLAYVSPAIHTKEPLMQQLRKAVSQDGKLIYSKKITFPNTPEGDFSTVIENLTTTKSSSQNHSLKSFSLYLFETSDKAALDAIQAHAQELFRNNKHAVHFTTEPEEVIRQLQLLLAADQANSQRIRNRITSKTQLAYKRLVYKQRVLLLRTLKRLGLFTAFRKIYRGLRKDA